MIIIRNDHLSNYKILGTSESAELISKRLFLENKYSSYPSQIITPSPLLFEFNSIAIFTSNGSTNGLNERERGHIGTINIPGILFYMIGPPAESE